MSAYSTIYITHSKAIAYIMGRLVTASNQELEEILDRLLEERLYNTRITDGEPNDNHIL